MSRRYSNNWSIVHSRPCSHARRSWRLKSSGRSSGLSPKETTSALGILELSGKVERTASGSAYWRKE